MQEWFIIQTEHKARQPVLAGIKINGDLCAPFVYSKNEL